ncbi:MAG TPA: GYF domain-containing protein [Candidatus Methylacidiphilales bacterium]|nr:GYF domain-containing protein [Candidatus Methylacidiphilales bacterium]
MWYYVSNGQQQGPVDDTGLDELIAGQVITPETLVWTEGQPAWAPLKQLRSTVPYLAASPVTDQEATCMVCNTKVGADNLINLVGMRVCAACKPKALQAMQEGAVLTGKNTAWYDGKRLVVCDGTYLPQRCLKCNSESTQPPLKRKVMWHSPAYYLLILINIFLYLIVAIFVRKRATIHVYLCERHRQRRLYFIIGTWAGLALGIALAFAGIVVSTQTTSAILVIAGFVLMLGAIFVGLSGAIITRTVRIKDNLIWLTGAGKEFLASLPPWTGIGF